MDGILEMVLPLSSCFSFRSWFFCLNLKIICKEVDEQKVLLSSVRFRNVKENLGLLLEQELGAYRKIRLLRQNRSQTMRKTILKILSQVVYDEEDSVVHINMIRIAKVRGSGESGYVDLNECLQSLYKAKETMVMSENKNDYGSVCNTLAEAHCLRTFCNQEARPNSKILRKLWRYGRTKNNPLKLCCCIMFVTYYLIITEGLHGISFSRT
ncbi:separase isoform X2 [Helianthus annuus]|uniref:separase isoform X2 n=1 Tax=Helianthus annuus TaxID=4232 RepID=UPI001652EECC|nr:separase isoform X2 [Helianthus annuus]